MRKRVLLICQRSNNVPFIFEVAKSMDIELIVVYAASENPPIHMPAVVGSLCLPVFDEPGRAIEMLLHWVKDHHVDGIVTQREEAVVWTAMAAQRLGLSSITIEAALAARDKHRMRSLFVKHGLNVPHFCKITSLKDIDSLPELIYPKIVKPTSAFGSCGVILVHNRQELEQAVGWIIDQNDKKLSLYSRYGEENFAGILIEDFIPGKEYCADCYAIDGEVRVLSLSYKGEPKGPYFEEGLCLTPAPDLTESLRQALIAEAIAGMNALGIQNGPGHCEMRLDGYGRPNILEIGARLGGSGTSHAIVEQSTGLNYAGFQYRFVLGEKISPDELNLPAERRVVCNYIIPLKGHGILKGIDGIEELEQKKGCYRLLRFIPNGTKVAPYPLFDGFIGFVLSNHETQSESAEFVEWMENYLNPLWEETADV